MGDIASFSGNQDTSGRSISHISYPKGTSPSQRGFCLVGGESKYLRRVFKPHTIPEGYIAPSIRVLSSRWESKYLRTVYKPHSVQQQGKPCAWAIISLGGMSPHRSMRPTRDWRPPAGGCTYGGEQPPAVRRRLRPCLALLPAGVTWPRTLLRAPVVFYTTFSPLQPPPPLPY
jgi:hypothetical protein